MKLKWIYLLVTITILITFMIIIDTTSWYYQYTHPNFDNWMWVGVIVSGIMTIFVWIGFIVKGSKINKHFEKKLTFKIK